MSRVDKAISVESSGEEGEFVSQRRRPRRSREQRRLRLRRRGRRAYIRSVYFLPSLATLGNAVSGFAAIYVAAMVASSGTPPRDPWANFFVTRGFAAAAYLIFLAMVFDALDGRLARFARHTTDFGGQLDSMADVISFGVAPAFVALRLFRVDGPELSLPLTRLVWAMAALYVCCAAIRLARFNVSNQHGEQHHFSFLGLPSPGAAGAVASLILMEQELARQSLDFLAQACLALLPLVVLGTGLLMVSHVRYPHFVNRYLRGRRSIGRLILIVGMVLLVVVAHQYVLGIGALTYAAWGPGAWLLPRIRRWMRPRVNPG
ncbi:MAG: CDP-diacylglycerol--serine O-phosphatidyltransferase [Tepidisphaeraceae bacterium]